MMSAAKPVGRPVLLGYGPLITNHLPPLAGFLIATLPELEIKATRSKHRYITISNRNKNRCLEIRRQDDNVKMKGKRKAASERGPSNLAPQAPQGEPIRFRCNRNLRVNQRPSTALGTFGYRGHFAEPESVKDFPASGMNSQS